MEAVEMEFETPAKLALSLAKEASPDSSGKDILKKYREIVAQKSAERLLRSQQSKNTVSVNSSHSHSDGSSLIKSSDMEGLSMNSRNSRVNLTNSIQAEHSTRSQKEMSTFSIYKDNTVNQTVDSQKENRDPRQQSQQQKSLKDRLLSKKTKAALQSRSVNIPTDNQQGSHKFGKKVISKNTRKVSLSKTSSVETKRKMYVNVDIEPPVDNTRSSCQITKTPTKKIISHVIQSSTEEEEEEEGNSKLESTPSNNESHRNASLSNITSDIASPLNFSTIENNNSIWAMAGEVEVGNDGDSMFSHEDDVDEEVESSDSQTVRDNTNDDDDYESDTESEEPSMDLSSKFESETQRAAPDPATPAFSETSKALSRSSGSRFSSSSATFDHEAKLSYADMFSPEEVKRANVSAIVSDDSGTSNHSDVHHDSSGATFVPDVAIEKDANIMFSPGEIKARNLSSSLHSSGRRSVSGEVRNKSKEISYNNNDEEVEEETVDNYQSNSNAHVEESITSKSYQQSRKQNATKEDAFDCISPASKALATGVLSSTSTQKNSHSPGIPKSAAASLIERNKTLVKEVRFADQTCVELSERNSSLQRDVDRLEDDILNLKQDNNSLHDAIVRSSNHSAKMEESRDTVKLKMEKERERHEIQLQMVKEQLMESKDQVSSLTQKLEESQIMKSSVEQELATLRGKHEVLHTGQEDSKNKIAGLMEKLSTTQCTTELAATSAAESYRDFCKDMQARMDHLQDVAEDRLNVITEERNQRIRLQTELEDLKAAISEYEKDDGVTSSQETELVTPRKPTETPTPEALPVRTPTSTVLAKTLQSELRKGHDVTERIIEAEKIISVTQTQLKVATTELEESRTQNAQLMKQLQKYKRGASASQKQDSYSGTASNAPNFNSSGSFLSESVFYNKLIQTRSECEKSKQELTHVLEKIENLQERSMFSNSDLSDKLQLMKATQSLATIGSEMSATNQQDDPASLCVMEEGSRSTFALPGGAPKESITPAKFVVIPESQEIVSPYASTRPVPSSLFSPMVADGTPAKITEFREEILSLESKLSVATCEKDAVSVVLKQAQKELSVLSQEQDYDAARGSDSMKAVESLMELKHANKQISTMEKNASKREKKYESVISSLKKTLAEREKTCKQLQHEKEISEEDVEKTTQEINDACDRICVLEKEVFERTARINKLGEYINEHDLRNQEQKDAYDQISQELINLKLTHTACNEEYEHELKRNSELNQLVNTLKTKVTSLEENLKNRIEQLSEITAKEESAHEKYAVELNSHKALVKEYKALQREIESLVAVQSNYKADIELLRDEIDIKTKDLESRNYELSVQEKILEDKDNLLKEERFNRQHAEDCFEDKIEEFNELSNNNVILSQKNAKLRDYVKQLIAKCEEWKSCHDEKEEALCQLEDDYEDATAMITDLTEQGTALRSELQSRQEIEAKMKDQAVQCSVNIQEEISADDSNFHCTQCKYLRKAIAKESSLVSALKRDNQRKGTKIQSLGKKLDSIQTAQNQA